MYWTFIFVAFVVLCEYRLVNCEGDVCISGWFGPSCQFKCQCSNGCDKSGQCNVPQQCFSKWFGYKCQYKDAVSYITYLSTNISVYAYVLYDSDDSTCIISDSIKTVAVTLSLRMQFLSMRLVVSNTASLEKFTVYFMDTTIISKRVECHRQQFTFIDNKTVDIRCEINELVNTVILQGEGVTSLCSVYVNRGRNVALNQIADQSSTNGSYIAKNAVDGNADRTFNRGSCTLTENVTDTNPTWSIRFNKPVVVSSFEVYNRDDSPMYQYFYASTLLTMNTNNETIYSFSLNVYSYDSVPNVNKVPIQRLKITASRFYYSITILSFCELYVFGECSPGKWDLDCKQSCRNECPNSCNEWDGSCPTGCLGYHPPECTQECPLDKWGVNCREDCSDRCQYKYCNSVDGLCTAGCNGYADPPYCTKPCKDGYYGLNCVNQYQQRWTTGHYEEEMNERGFQFSASNFGIGLGSCAGAALIIVALVIIIKYNHKQRRNDDQQNSRTTYDDINTTSNSVRYAPQPTTDKSAATEVSLRDRDKHAAHSRTETNYMDCTPSTQPEESVYEEPNYINVPDDVIPK